MFDLKVRLVWLNVASLGLYNSIAVKKSVKKFKVSICLAGGCFLL